MHVVALSMIFAQRPTPIAEMDFEPAGHLIYFPIKVNGHNANAVLDTGAAATIMDRGLADEWRLEESGQIPIGGVGKDAAYGKLLRNANATFAGLTTPVKIAVPLAGLAQYSGRQLDVVIGFDFLANHVVEVDYPHHHLAIFDKDAELGGNGTAAPIRIVQNHMHLKSQMQIGGQSYELETMIDTGAGAVGSLTSKFLQAHALDVQQTPRAVIGAGIGGTTDGSLFRPDSVTIDGFKLAKPVIILSASTGGAVGAASAFDFLIGGEALERFKITVDYPHSRLLFQPGARLNDIFEADKSGLRVQLNGMDFHSFRIVGVLPGSSAAEAGLKVGDFIESIDGKTSLELTLQEVKVLFRSPTAKSWNLEIRRGPDELKVTLPAKSII